LGCVAGLLSFSRLISWVLAKFYNITIALLSGFMIGSINKIWPWKEVIEYRVDRHGDQVPLVDQSILPNQYFVITGNDPQFLNAMLFTTLAIILVLGSERISSWISPPFRK
jgi:putative membrane protein